MRYDEALNYIHGTLKFGIKLGLQNIETLLDLLGNPHKNLRFVHIAGTNGKGSTASFINSILIEAGYKTGLFTSPYIQRFSERIKINNLEISESDIARITEVVREKAQEMTSKGENHPTEFEIVTAIAFLYYSENNCDIVVLETGLGGRFDSTNIIDTPLVSVITTIDYDHTDKLGKSLPEIAFEKAGIIKKNSNVVLYPQYEEVEKVFCNVSKEQQAMLYKVDLSGINVLDFGIDGQRFDYKEYKSLFISLLGKHQINNAVTAINALDVLKGKGFVISHEVLRKGLANAKWVGRFEVLNREPIVIIDGAHNAQGAKVLSSALEQYFPGRKKTMIIGVLKDKDVKALIEAVLPVADKFITVTPKSDRAMPAEELAGLISTYGKNVVASSSVFEAVREAMNAEGSDVICAFGSLYYIGEVRKIFGL